MRIAVVGSRSIVDKDWVNYHLDKMILGEVEAGGNVTIISGGAKGADTLAREWAALNLLDFILFKPYHLIDNSVMYHPRYFFTRNKQIVDNADQVIVFWDGKSNGSKDVMKYARKCGKLLTVIEWDGGLENDS